MVGDISAGSSFVLIEEEVRRFWRRHEVPTAALAARSEGTAFVLYQEPLRAAGQLAADQIRLQSVTDLLARYRSMRGDSVYCQRGWACHGLPIERAVEEALGPALADYDLARFTAACQDAALQGVQRGDVLAERLGVWFDPTMTFVSSTSQAVGAVWSVLRRLWDAGRLRHQVCVVSVCPRCATPLSTMEAGQRALEVDACAVWLRLPWDREPDAYLLVWTPMPWMLVGMVALAVHPDAGYALIELAGRGGGPATRLVLAEAALDRTLTGDYRIIQQLSGRSLRGVGYGPPFTFRPAPDTGDRVVLSDRVPLDRGTGLMPVTPCFDAPSLALAMAQGLAVPDLLDDWGNWVNSVTPWRGLSPLDAEPLLVENLQARGLLFRQERDVRHQALCPYCETPLLPQARDAWLVAADSGPWIVGRDRAWGIPLPVWTCARCREMTCLAGLDDLAGRVGLEVGQLALHRPAIDQLRFPCEACGGTMQRVVPVVDAALEAAVLPWAMAPQPGSANLAISLGDRDLGWLGDLAEVAALLRGTLAWEQAVSLPEVEGEMTHLHLEPTQPADALRWAVYSHMAPSQVEQELLRPLWQMAAASRVDSASPGRAESRVGRLFHRWLLARFHVAIASLTEALDRHDVEGASGELAALLDDLTGWYASHRPQGVQQVMGILCALLAPFVPHLAEAMHRQTERRAEESIHLAAWPRPDPAWEDSPLLACMVLVRRLEAQGRTARLQAGIASDRLLPRAVVYLHGRDDGGAAELDLVHDLLAEVLRVSDVRYTPEAMAHVAWRLMVDTTRTVDRRLDRETIQAGLENLQGEKAIDITKRLWDGMSVSIQVAGQALTLLPDEVAITSRAQPGWTAAHDAGLLLLLETG